MSCLSSCCKEEKHSKTLLAAKDYMLGNEGVVRIYQIYHFDLSIGEACFVDDAIVNGFVNGAIVHYLLVGQRCFFDDAIVFICWLGVALSDLSVRHWFVDGL